MNYIFVGNRTAFDAAQSRPTEESLCDVLLEAG